MKKLLAILLVISLICASFLFTACGGKNEDEDAGSENEITDAADTEKDSDGENEDEGLTYDKDSAQAKLAELGEKDGYEISFKVTEAGGDVTEYTTGRKENIWWTLSGGEGMACMQNGDTGVTTYEYDGTEWTISSNLVGQDIDDIISIYGTAYTVYLFFANAFEDSLEKDGHDTIAGRSCTIYKYEVSALDASVIWNACVDDELGITLRWGLDMNSAEDSSFASMEVTSFKSGSDVSVPTLPAPGEDYQDFTGAMGWPDNSFTALIPKAPGTVSLSMVQDGQFSAVLKDVTEDDFKSYVSELESAGFTKNEDESAEGIMFNGTDSDGNTAAVQFGDGQLIVALQKAE